MDREDLEALREGWQFEAKRAAGRDGHGKLPESFWETYSAMGNTEGGYILLGAKERADGSLQVEGLRDVQKVERELWNGLSNREKVSANILSKQDVERVAVGERAALLVQVPKASRDERPLYVNGSWERGTFLRIGDGDRRAPRETSRRMLADAISDRDNHALEERSIDDFDDESVERYRQLLLADRPDHSFRGADRPDLLVAIGAAKLLKGTERLAPTWAGLWMLGKELAIRDLLPHWHLSYKELPRDPEEGPRWLDRIAPDGTWNANLLNFYRRIRDRLFANVRVPFELHEDQRVEHTPVHRALREALVNTLIHADYQGTTGVRVEVRASGFEFINPGLLLVSREQLWKGGISAPRNPTLQRMFGLLRLGEREGSGGPMVRQVWKRQHWRPPHLVEDVENGETHLVLSQESLLPDWALDALQRRWGGRFSEQDELGRVILVTAEAEGTIQHARVRELTEAHPHDITLKLRELVRAGLLESEGKTRATAYSPVRPHETQQVLAFPPAGGTGSPPDKRPSPPDKPPSPPDKRPSPPDKRPGPDISLVEEVAASKRAGRHKVRSAIQALCAGEYVTVAELANKLNRKPITIQQEYVTKMVDEGLLTARFPNAPSHPRQAYRSDREHEEA